MALTRDEFKKIFNKLLMEFVGTGILVLTIQLTYATGRRDAAVAIGLVFTAIVYAGFFASGAHYNPAITLGAYLRGLLPLQEMLMYWILQLLGGFCGALLGVLIGGARFSPSIGSSYNFLQAFLAEFVFTSLLVFVYLAVIPKGDSPKGYFGLALGFTVYASTASIKSISGASINPAVIFGLALLRSFWRHGYTIWIILANLLGGIVGTIIYYGVDPEMEVREVASRLSTRGEQQPLVGES